MFELINSKVTGHSVFNQLGRHIQVCTSDIQETAFSFQSLSLTIQRFNVVCLMEAFVLTMLILAVNNNNENNIAI